MYRHALNRTHSLDSGLRACDLSWVSEGPQRHDWHRITAHAPALIEEGIAWLEAACSDPPRAPWPHRGAAMFEGDLPCTELARIELTKAVTVMERALLAARRGAWGVRRASTRCPQHLVATWRLEVAGWMRRARRALRTLVIAAELLGGPITDQADATPLRPLPPKTVGRALLAARAALAAIPEHREGEGGE